MWAPTRPHSRRSGAYSRRSGPDSLRRASPSWRRLLGLEVLQHRILLVLTALLGLAEWRVRSGRNPSSPWRYVFPLVFIVSGTVLLSHAHEVNDARSSFLMELTHLPMGLVVLVAGWARWLELRLPPVDGRRAGQWWGPALCG